MIEQNSLPLSGGAIHPTPQDLRDPHLATAELDTIIGYFVRGHKHFVADRNLKLEYTDTSIRLSDLEGRLVGISKQVNPWQRKVLLSNKSAYTPRIIKAAQELGFITKQRSAHPDFSEHHYYQVPEGYQLKYTEVIDLWKVWWHNKRYQLNDPNPPINVLTFAKGKWYSIRDLQPKQGSFIIKTERGEVAIEPEDYVVWLESKATIGTEPKSLTTSQLLLLDRQQIRVTKSPSLLAAEQQSEPNIAIEVPISGPSVPAAKPTGVVSSTITNVKIPQTDEFVDRGEYEDIDLESYLSTFNTEDAEDIERIEGIYNIGELLSSSAVKEEVVPALESEPPATPNVPAATRTVTASITPMPDPVPSLTQRQAALKSKAVEVLAKYIQEGDRIVHTEVLKNALGQEVNRKVSIIQRGCPGWAIAQVQQLISSNTRN